MRLRYLAATTLALCLMVTPAFGATPGRYVGHTSDKRPVSLVASKTRVRSFTLQTRFTCSNGTGFVASATFGSMKLKRNRFNATFHNKPGSLRTTLKGSIRGRKASGTIRRRARFNAQRKLDPSGTLVCTANTRFTAKR